MGSRRRKRSDWVLIWVRALFLPFCPCLVPQPRLSLTANGWHKEKQFAIEGHVRPLSYFRRLMQDPTRRSYLVADMLRITRFAVSSGLLL